MEITNGQATSQKKNAEKHIILRQKFSDQNNFVLRCILYPTWLLQQIPEGKAS